MKHVSLSQPSPRPIKPLPPDVVAQIKSSTAITDLATVILGLVQNSLDADATKVEVVVYTRRGGCVVEDDGHGILPSEFKEEGGLGKHYYTSKHESPVPVHGRNGTFLASLGALSVLTITSHHYLHRSHNTITLHRSQVISRLVPAPHQQELGFRDHGTRVTMRDLFGNMPVRVKQRAMMADDRPENERQWESMKKVIVSLILAWKQPLSVRIRDGEGSRSLVLQNNRQKLVVSSDAAEGRGMKKVHSELRPLLSMLSQASYITPDEWSSWVPASASTTSISVKGAISLEPAATKSIQFISVGIKPIFSDRGHNELFDEVNRLFNASSFGTVDDGPELDEKEKERRLKDKRFKTDGPTNKELRGGRKGIDRWPMFCLHVTIKELKKDDVDDVLSSEAKLHSILEVLRAMVTQWLSMNHFQPRARRSRRIDSRPGSATSTTSGSSTRASTGDRRSDIELNEPVLTALSESAQPVPWPPTQGILGSSTTGQKRRRTSNSAIRAATDTTRSETTVFSDWSRIKSAKPSYYEDIWTSKKPIIAPHTASAESSKTVSMPQETPSTSKHPDSVRSSNFFQSGTTLPGQLGHPDESFETSPQQGAALLQDKQNEADNSTSIARFTTSPPREEMVQWTDPMTQETYRINSRTGVVMDRDTNTTTSKQPTSGSIPATTSTTFHKPLRLSQRPQSTPMKSDGNRWLDDFLKKWDNPIFRPSTAAIPQVSLHGLSNESTGILSGRNSHCSHDAIKQAFTEASTLADTKLSKQALKRASVIAQLDKKFILTVMDGKDPAAEVVCQNEGKQTKRMLVIIDQHAADERCRIEELLAELCSPASGQSREYRSELGHAPSIQTVILAEAIYFEISDREAPLFEMYAGRFAEWGILYDLGRSGSRHVLIAKTLPPGISERCQADVKLLISLLRSEIWKLSGSGARASSSKTQPLGGVEQQSLQPRTSEERRLHSWLSKISNCPEGMLDMLNSRACRSAIMFNDELSVAQCSELIARLATCAFPFQCAHGRPSMVPLVEVGWVAAAYVAGGLDQEGFGESGSSGGGGENADEGRGSGFVEAFRRWRGDEEH